LQPIQKKSNRHQLKIQRLPKVAKKAKAQLVKIKSPNRRWQNHQKVKLLGEAELQEKALLPHQVINNNNSHDNTVYLLEFKKLLHENI
jgi:hypothetical protein